MLCCTLAGRSPETPLDLDLQSNQIDHSFLSVDEAYSPDDQESKGVPTPLDEEVSMDIRSELKEIKYVEKAEAKPLADPKEVKRVKKAEAKSLAELKIVAGAKQLAEEKSDDDDSVEEKSQEVRRRFCVMRADLEGKPSWR